MADSMFWYGGTPVTENNLTIGETFSNFDGLSRTDRLRYDTPSFGGFSLASSVSSGDAFDGALLFSRQFGETKVATAFAAAGRDLDGSLLTETAALLPRVPLAVRAVPGTPELAASIAPHVQQHNAVLLGNHGVVTMGVDLCAAFALLETVERLAQVTLLAEVAAGRSPIDDQTLRLLQGGENP